jgi:hypothetical protein
MTNILIGGLSEQVSLGLEKNRRCHIMLISQVGFVPNRDACLWAIHTNFVISEEIWNVAIAGGIF